jgi:hypothetical protein
MLAVMSFISDKRFALVSNGQKGLQSNKRATREGKASIIIIPTIMGPLSMASA